MMHICTWLLTEVVLGHVVDDEAQRLFKRRPRGAPLGEGDSSSLGLGSVALLFRNLTLLVQCPCVHGFALEKVLL